MRLTDYDIDTRYAAKVVSNEGLTDTDAEDEVCEIVLDVADDGISYKVGQIVGVLVPGPHEFGQPWHHRLYSIADVPAVNEHGHSRITIVVRRCDYVDEYSGERFRGVSSNYLCDRRPGDPVTLTGPFGQPFSVPANRSANLFMIGLGTGIAPFRGLVKRIYEHEKNWQGKVRLLYGARSGLELLYMNDRRDDFSKYYDEETFEAIKALSPRPNWADPIAWDYAIEDRVEEIVALLDDPNTYVYVAGVRQIASMLDQLFSSQFGPLAWDKRKQQLVADGRWVELLY